MGRLKMIRIHFQTYGPPSGRGADGLFENGPRPFSNLWPALRMRHRWAV